MKEEEIGGSVEIDFDALAFSVEGKAKLDIKSEDVRNVNRMNMEFSGDVEPPAGTSFEEVL